MFGGRSPRTSHGAAGGGGQNGKATSTDPVQGRPAGPGGFSVLPASEGGTASEAQPKGEVRAFDLPLVAPQGEGAHPSPAQRINAFADIHRTSM